MKAWQLFVHSVRLIVNNFESALRISGVLYLVQAITQIYLFQNMDTEVLPDGTEMPVMALEDSFAFLLLSIFSVVASLWIAVAWHRFVLNEEYPSGWMPRWHGANMLGYLGRSILIGLLITVGCLVISLPLGLMAALLPFLLPAMPVVIILFGVWVFFRLSPVLPAAALGQTVSLRAAWSETAPFAKVILQLSAIVVAAFLLIMTPSLLAAGTESVIALVYDLAIGWLVTMVGISTLTTVYGHVVEGRGVE